jgi:serine/threonine-protein kinase RsbW
MSGTARSSDATGRHAIELLVPADPEFRRLARLAAADVGTRAGFDLEEIDDLRIGVDELSAAIVGPESTAGRMLALRFSFSASLVEVDGRCCGDVPPLLDDLSRAICTAVVDEYGLEVGDGDRRFSLSKRSAA